jgi:curli biogenesis system outer membrane secretion channel CsgG
MSGRRFVVYGMCWLCLGSAVWAANLKKTVAVSRFENKTAWKGQVMLDDGMADQLTDALIQSGMFIVLERQTLGDVMAEQDLAASGRAAASKTAQTGKLTSAQILIKGTITEFENKSAGSGSGLGVGPVRLSNKREEAHVGLIVRLIDTTTGQVLDSQRVEGKATAGGMGVGVSAGVVDFGTEGFVKTPLGKATQITIDNAVAYITGKLKGLPYQGRVIKAAGDEVYIAAGQRNGCQVGDVFTVFSVGEGLLDPETGEKLGQEEKRKGTIKVYDVQEKFSKAKPEGTMEQVNAGDVIRSQ